MEHATRPIKLETIRKSVEECSRLRLPAIKDKLISECSKWWGVRRQSAQELIKELVTNEAIVCDGEDVWSYARWEKIKEAREKDMASAKETVRKIFNQ